jgi:hypothetical protein
LAAVGQYGFGKELRMSKPPRLDPAFQAGIRANAPAATSVRNYTLAERVGLAARWVWARKWACWALVIAAYAIFVAAAFSRVT